MNRATRDSLKIRLNFCYAI